MAGRLHEPTQGTSSAIAAVLGLAVIVAAPVLAAPERDASCAEATAPTLKVVETEFTYTSRERSESAVDLLEPRLLTSPRNTLTAEREDEPEAQDDAGEDAASATEPPSPPPTKAGPLIYKRQMYRRDI